MNLIKTLRKYLANLASYLFLLRQSDIEEKTLLIIRPDAIGDYILFRNFLEEISLSDLYKHYKITLLGDSSWKEISQMMDRRFVDEFIWIDRKKFRYEFLYKLNKLYKITSIGYQLIFHPNYTRDFFVGDNIVGLVRASEKIGTVGDLSNIKTWQKKISDKFYSELIDIDRRSKFEFYRNKEIVESFLKKNIDLHKPKVEIDKDFSRISLPDKYAVIFPGAGFKFRKWPAIKFSKVAQFLVNNYEMKIIICGGPAEKEDAEIIIENLCKSSISNWVGKTTLTELAYIISKSCLLVSNETSAPHFSMAANVPTVVVSNGNHLGRFTPYPPELSDKYKAVFPPEIESNLNNWSCLIQKYGNGSKIDINQIQTKKVINKIHGLLSQ